MPKVLQCWELGNGLGYLEALTENTKALSQAGYEVGLALRDLSHTERLLGGNFELFQAPTLVKPIHDLIRFPMTHADILHNLGYNNADRVMGKVRAWRTLFKYFKPDVLYCVHAPGALLAARGLGIKTGVAGTGLLIPPQQSPLPNLRYWITDVNREELAAREARVTATVNQVLKTLGAPPLTSLGDLYAVDAQALRTFPELDEYGAREHGDYRGAYQTRGGAPPNWPNGGDKRVFVYLELFEALPALLHSLKQTGHSILVYLAHAPDELYRRYSGDNLAITDIPLDLTKTAHQCDYGINHGGHNIVATMLLAGKPQLCLPLVFPERIIADKVMRLGAGLMAAPQVNVMVEALNQLLTQAEMAQKAREFSQKYSDFDADDAIQKSVQTIAALVQPVSGTKRLLRKKKKLSWHKDPPSLA